MISKAELQAAARILKILLEFPQDQRIDVMATAIDAMCRTDVLQRPQIARKVWSGPAVKR
jgi:hypothetical protein